MVEYKQTHCGMQTTGILSSGFKKFQNWISWPLKLGCPKMLSHKSTDQKRQIITSLSVTG